MAWTGERGAPGRGRVTAPTGGTTVSDRSATPPHAVTLPQAADAVAPDGSEVRLLVTASGASAAHFRLPAGATSVAVRHRSVDEIWFVVEGRGEMWLATDDDERLVALQPGVCVSIPCGTRFQFRADDGGTLGVYGVTMPPWPGDGEAIRSVGPWAPSVRAGDGLAEEAGQRSAR
jgi:mannose-6-phosphate isomerase-like protein (cupin superfamily)